MGLHDGLVTANVKIGNKTYEIQRESYQSLAQKLAIKIACIYTSFYLRVIIMFYTHIVFLLNAFWNNLNQVAQEDWKARIILSRHYATENTSTK